MWMISQYFFPLFQLQFLRNYCTGFARSKVSATSEQLIDYAEKFLEFDAILTPVSPSSPWVSDDQSYWLLNQSMYVNSILIQCILFIQHNYIRLPIYNYQKLKKSNTILYL